MLQIGMFLGDRYEILEKIGTGGMADVYKARCHKLNRLVAVKVLKPEYCRDKSFVSRFRVEAQAAAGLTHPNIVNVYDVGDEGDMHYIVMELVEGITLKEYIAKKGKLDIRESIGITIQVAQGMNAAHQQHIIHRDIKPQNIIISKDGKVKVTDFGIAHAASGDTINSSSGTMGSVHYTSPEQARGGYCDERSDIYSLGIALYEMLTGQVPFDGDNTVAVALAHIQNEMVPPRQLNPTIPVSLEKIILKCTQKKPERRYTTAVELIADLRKALMMPDQDFVKAAPKEDMSNTQMIGVGTLSAIREGEQEDADSSGQAFASEGGQQTGSAEGEVPDGYEDAEDYDDDQMEYDDEEEYDDGRYDEDFDDDEDLKDSRFDKVILGAGITVAVVIVVLALYVIARAFNIFPGGGGKETETSATESAIEGTTLASTQTRMPNLIGASVNDVDSIMASSFLKASYQYEYSDEYEKNYVCRQQYEEGEILDKQTTVTVWISKGKEESKMPDVVGKTEEQAMAELRSLNLNLNIKQETEYSAEQEAGRVTRTNPSKDQDLKTGDTVTVYISLGEEAEEVEVPDLFKLTQAEAASRLAERKLSLGEVKEDYSPNVEAGHVISQDIVSGTKVEAGTRVGIVISKGKQTEMVRIPSVVNSTEAEAKKTLEDAKLKVNVTTEHNDSVDAGRVISQSPSADTEVEEGIVVTIVISLGKEVKYQEVPDMRGKTEAYITGAMSALKLKPVFVDGSDNSVGADQCYGQDIQAGTKLPEGSEVKFYINRVSNTDSGDNAG